MLYWDPVFPQSSHEAAASPPTEEETGLAQHEGLPKPPWSKWEPRALHPNPLVTFERSEPAERTRTGWVTAEDEGGVGERRVGKELPHLSLEGGLVL